MNDRFDRYNWESALYCTPEELDDALNSFQVKGKQLKQIRAIGMAFNMGQQELRWALRRTLADVGIPYEVIDSGNYPWMEQTLLPCEVKLCEPVILVFEDDSALEICPENKQGLRIALGQIEPCLSDGLNRSNFDADVLFSRMKGESFKSISVYHEEATCRSASSVLSEHSEIITWRLLFDGRFDLYFRQDWPGTFTFGIAAHWNLTPLGFTNATMAYAEAIKATRHVWRIPITEGPGEFRIMPINDSGLSGQFPEGVEIAYDQAISLDEEYLGDFLFYFLNKYFDPKYPYEKIRKYRGQCEFDWYSNNIYSYPTMHRMLDEMAHCAQLLAANYDDPSLAPIKKRFTLDSFAPDHPDRYTLSDSEKDAIIKQNIHVAVDFYDRFISRVRNMMAACKGCTAIDFEGP